MPYTRTTVALRSRQRTRLVGTVGAVAGNQGPWNVESEHGNYWRVWTRGGNVRVGFSSLTRPPFLHQAQVSTGANSSEARVTVDPIGTLLITYTRTVGAAVDVMLTRSTDDGLTWTAGTVAIVGGRHGHCHVSRDGTLYVAGYVGGKISFTRRALGDLAPTAEAFIKTDLGADMLVADDQFSMTDGAANDWPLILAVRINGENDISEWLSWDSAATWKRLT